MKIVKNIIGNRYGRIVVVSFSHVKNKFHYYNCVCDCGNKTVVLKSSLVRGHTKSCGCYKKEVLLLANITHGDTIKTDTPEYRAWKHMQGRCYNNNDSVYKDYGGRGITVCKEWRNNYSQFLKDMGRKPKGLTLERIKNNEGYSKENCKWATRKEQANNRRVNITLTLNEKTHNISQWSNILGINKVTLRSRIILGWSIERTLTTPITPKK